MELDLEKRKRLAEELKNLKFNKISEIIWFDQYYDEIINTLNNILFNEKIEQEIKEIFEKISDMLLAPIIIDEFEEKERDLLKKEMREKIRSINPELLKIHELNLLMASNLSNVLSQAEVFEVYFDFEMPNELENQYKKATLIFSGEVGNAQARNYVDNKKDIERIEIAKEVFVFGKNYFFYLANHLNKETTS